MNVEEKPRMNSFGLTSINEEQIELAVTSTAYEHVIQGGVVPRYNVHSNQNVELVHHGGHVYTVPI